MEDERDRAERRDARIGTALVWVGVAVWPVWGTWFLLGDAPSVVWAVLLHLLLVVPGGSLLRRSRPSVDARRDRRKRIGTLLVVFGVSAWIPYFVLTESGREVPSWPFLIVHLSGVIPGAILRYTRWGAGTFS